jgi:hypothetical protein
MDWQPIATAPKDGTTVLVWSRGVHFGECYDGWTWANPHRVYEWSDGDCSDMPFDEQPTHWMPLPESPRDSDTRPKDGDA